ncbi:hypothetical protein VPG91_11420 [Nitrospirillum amazonense]|uniref:hypothetical protein n=1 Tax=Nitrospirillum amazonense TaxID=28077 RepID=UPI002DD448E5|nr:hypothetical protein [Nitrospirillum amazonense]MEC4591598.1 hypothetical protein [Nitrospirillum amazonense]
MSGHTELEFTIASLSYDFPGKSISARLQANAEHKIVTVAVSAPLNARPGESEAELEHRSKEALRDILKAALKGL